MDEEAGEFAEEAGMEWLGLVLAARPKHPRFPSNNLQPSHRIANVLQHYPSPWTSWACQKPRGNVAGPLFV